MTTQEFNLEEVYDEKISPLLKQIIEVCNEHDLPMVASFCYSLDKDGKNAVVNTVLNFEDRTPERLQHAAKAIYGEHNCILQLPTPTKKEQSK